MAGIYIHIPFCKQKCSYCDFHFSTSYQGYRTRMLDSMHGEIVLKKDLLKNQLVESIYFGGGTPSLLTAKELSNLLQAVKKDHSISANCEITLEVNPDDVVLELCQQWFALGINRLSIGIQSFDAADLNWMNRAHTAEESAKAVRTAQKAGFSNLSIDLIYGLPEMDVSRWEKQILRALDLKVQHISAYCLTIEEKTALHQEVKKGKLIPADQDLQSEHFNLLVKKLKQAGFVHYEVSNFALPEHFAQHNSNYWRGIPFIGIGPSAHSFSGTTRSWNIANNMTYMKALENGQLAQETEVLGTKERYNELVLTGLRTIWGVSLTQLEAIAPKNPDFDTYIKRLILEGKAVMVDENLSLTPEGMLFADGIAQDLFLD